MSNFSKGKYAKFISDRSGMEFPYTEMVREWNGSRVHVSEFESKQPQLQPRAHGADPEGLQNAKPDRTEPAVASMLPSNPISTTANSSTISISEPNNGRALNDIIELRNVDGSPGGLAFTVYETSFIITSVTTNSFTFNLNTTTAITEKAGGSVVTAGPVTLTP